MYVPPANQCESGMPRLTVVQVLMMNDACIDAQFQHRRLKLSINEKKDSVRFTTA